MKHVYLKLLFAIMLGISPAVMQAQIVDKDLTNLVIFMRFADDEEITHSFASIDTMFNGKTPSYLSVANFYEVMSYGHIHYNTVYTNDIHDGQIVSYRDTYPRGYFEPYSPSNPIGYQEELPFMGISMREAQLLARAFHYVDSLHLVDDDVVLDGDGDGYIDNVSFVVKGGTGAWASILWPHMEYPHPYLTDGTPENSFEITDIREDGNQLTFHVHFFYDGVDDVDTDESLSVYPNPVADRLVVSGRDMKQVELVNIMGQRVLVGVVSNDENVELSLVGLSSGVYLLRVLMDNGSTVVKKVVKE